MTGITSDYAQGPLQVAPLPPPASLLKAVHQSALSRRWTPGLPPVTHEDWQNHRSRISLRPHHWLWSLAHPRPVPGKLIRQMHPQPFLEFILVMLQIWVFKITWLEVRSRRGVRFRSSDTGDCPWHCLCPHTLGRSLGRLRSQRPHPS